MPRLNIYKMTAKVTSTDYAGEKKGGGMMTMVLGGLAFVLGVRAAPLWPRRARALAPFEASIRCCPQVLAIAFIALYAMTVAAVILNGVRTSVRSEIWPVLRGWALAAGGIYAGGFFTLWLPEVLLCPTGSHAPLVTVAWTRHLNLHAFFHLTSSVGPYCFLCFTTYHRYHNLRRRPLFVWDRPHPLLLLPVRVPRVALDAATAS